MAHRSGRGRSLSPGRRGADLTLHALPTLGARFAHLRVARADPDDLDAVRDLLSAAARRLRDQGIEQWPDPFPMDRVLDGYRHGEVYLVCDGATIVATQSVHDADPFWQDRPGHALYAHRLAVADGHRGLGAALLAWTEKLALAMGRASVRLDCVSSNRRLREYYETAGYEHRGDLAGESWAVSLYEKPVP